MNILFLAEVSAADVIGGAERVLVEQARGLRRSHHRVAIVARAPQGDPRLWIVVEDVPERRYPVSRRNGLTFVLSSLRNSVRALDDAEARIGRADAVVVHQALAGLGPVLWHRRGPAWVYVCHSLAHEEYRSRCAEGAGWLVRPWRALNAWLRQRAEAAVLRRCDRIIVLSEFMKRRVVDVHGIPPDRIHVIPGGADPDRFTPSADPDEVRRMLSLPPGRIVLFTVRNLVPRMGLEHLVRAMRLLDEEGRELLLLIGGEGPLRPGLERAIRESGLADRVRLLGFVPEKELPLYYRAATLVLMPTQELEGFGLVTVEALACGTPVLGTPVGAIPEVLGRIDPGLIAPGCDAEALAGAIREVLRHFRAQPAEATRLGDAGRRLVQMEYNWVRHTERVASVLREAGGQSGAEQATAT